jgi:hypothetical protein
VSGCIVFYVFDELIACVLCGRWLTLGNQLGPDQIFEDELAVKIKARQVPSLK